METKEFQKMCEKIVSDIDAKYDIKRDAHFSFVQMMEEIGELAKEINKPKLRGKEIDRENLEGEFADVVLQLAILAKIHDIDLEKAVNSKIELLKNRHNL